jgi:type IV pilus assembly protein PilB
MYRCMPVSLEGNTLQVAFEDPLDPAKVDELGFVAKKDIQLVLANPVDILSAIDRHYGDESSEDVDKILEELGGDEKITEEAMVAAETSDEDLVAGLANEAPIVRFVNLVLFQAVKDRASDIHFEPFETEFRIRYRVDGALYEMTPPPKHLALPVVSRIKVMANLNISERRLPQDGRINYKLGHKEIDLRVSTLPTQFGESVVLRVLDRSGESGTGITRLSRSRSMISSAK